MCHIAGVLGTFGFYDIRAIIHASESVLKFQEMLYSPKKIFNEADFSDYINRVKFAGFPQQAYSIVFHRVTNNLGELANKYRERGKDHWADSLWSGNIAHELIDLTQVGRDA